MPVARSLLLSLVVVVVFASRSFAQVSCAVADNLCTGDPCITANLNVQLPCTVNFGARALVIGGVLSTTGSGLLSLTAASILAQGRIDAGDVTLVANAGDADLRAEIDVNGGTLDVSATGNMPVKSRLKAKPGGTITLAADGTITTGVAAVIEARGEGGPGGLVTLSGDAGVTVGGRIFDDGNPGGIIQVTSSAGIVTLNKDLRVTGDHGPAGTVGVSGATGVVVNDDIRAASSQDAGGVVTVASAGGNIPLNAKIRANGRTNGGSIDIDAPLGTVTPRKLEARGKLDGGSITVAGTTVTVRDTLVVEGGTGNGGLIELAGSVLVTVDRAKLEAGGHVNGGTLRLLGDVASGDVTVTGGNLTADGKSGNGGGLVISAPAGAVDFAGRVNLAGKGGTGGTAAIDGDAITFQPKSRIDADGRTLGGEIRFAQSGAGLLLLDGTFEARDDGVVEALAPAGSLTVRGAYRAGPAGCVGLSSMSPPNTTGASIDVPVTASCP